jgi:hypothetical protein
MRPSIRALALAMLLMAAPAAAAPAAVVKLDTATQRRLGVATAPLAARQRVASVPGFARVLDPVPLATLDSDITAAMAALAASQAEADRSRALNAADQTVSRRAADAAAAQARADAAKLQLLRRRVGLEWGPSLAAFSDAQRGRLVADLAAGRAALVRIDSTGGVSPGRGSAILDLGPAGRATATILGATRSGDPRLQSTGLLGLVRGPQAMQLGSGTVAPTTLGAGATTSGVVIPRSALLRTGGQTYAYIRRDAESFERRPVTAGLTDSAGLFVAGGFRPGEAVVVVGASQLFAAETSQPAA